MTASIPLHRVYDKAPAIHKQPWEGLAQVHLHARKMSGTGREPAIHGSVNLLSFVSSDSNDLLVGGGKKKKKNNKSITPFPPLHPLRRLITARSQGTVSSEGESRPPVPVLGEHSTMHNGVPKVQRPAALPPREAGPVLHHGATEL